MKTLTLGALTNKWLELIQKRQLLLSDLRIKKDAEMPELGLRFEGDQPAILFIICPDNKQRRKTLEFDMTLPMGVLPDFAVNAKAVILFGSDAENAVNGLVTVMLKMAAKIKMKVPSKGIVQMTLEIKGKYTFSSCLECPLSELESFLEARE